MIIASRSLTNRAPGTSAIPRQPLSGRAVRLGVSLAQTPRSPEDFPPPPPPPPPQPRLSSVLLSLPKRVELYFEARYFRRTLWCALSSFAGYYSANMVSLSFGTLAINDVVAAAVSVLFCEVVSWLYYRSSPAPLKWQLANCFKMGVEAAFIADALKLAG